jgi:surface antigen
MTGRHRSLIATLAAVLVAGAGAAAPATAASTAASYVKTELTTNGGGNRLDVVVRVSTGRPNIRCRGTARQAGLVARLPPLRTGAKAGAQWHWYLGDNAPQAKLTIRVSCSFPDRKVRQDKIAKRVGPGPFPWRTFSKLIRPGSMRKEKWVPPKKRDGSGGDADLYPHGQCTWFVAKQRPDLPYFRGRSGDAKNWIKSAQAYKIPTGTRPRAGAVAVFEPGQYGAGYYGHVAYVTAFDAKRITVTEANYRRRPVGSKRTLPRQGVRFIYSVGDDVTPPAPPPPPLPPPPPPLAQPVLPTIATLLVSGPTGIAGAPDHGGSNGGTGDPAVSADGRYVAFSSIGSNLDPADADTTRDVFVRDLQAGTTTLVSRATGTSGADGDDSSSRPAISGDGRYVTFSSNASNLDPADDNATEDVFVRDLREHTTTLVSRASGTSGTLGNRPSYYPDISDNGRYVSFGSNASNLDPADDNRTRDVFVRDLLAGTTTLVSRATGTAGVTGNRSSFDHAISGDGRYVTFDSEAFNLDPADTDPTDDVFVRDLQAGTTTLVSGAVVPAGIKSTGSSSPDISSNGRYITFSSNASNLDPADTNNGVDVFVRDLQAEAGATTTLVSRGTGISGIRGSDSSQRSAISGDGRYVTFDSNASNLDPADTDNGVDVFVRDLQEHTTTLVSRATSTAGAESGGIRPAISGDGRYVTFDSGSRLDLADDDSHDDVFVRDLQLAATTLVSRATGTVGLKDHSFAPTVSSGGRYIAFESQTSKLDPADSDILGDVFVRDVQAGTTTLVSRATGAAGVKGNGSSSRPAISDDGRYVTFESTASNLDPADPDDIGDVFVRDLEAGTTMLVSGATGTAGVKGASSSSAISGDGRYVTFESTASNLDPADTDRTRDVFVRDVQAGTTMLVSGATAAAGVKGASSSPAISGNGRYVTFESTASNLDPADSDDVGDVFVRDLEAGTTMLVSGATGTAGVKRASSSPAISGDGRYVAFSSGGSNLDPADNDTMRDVFVRDVQAGTTTLVSRATGTTGIKGDGPSYSPAISGDGRYVTFDSEASNLDPADSDTISDVFVRGELGATTP